MANHPASSREEGQWAPDASTVEIRLEGMPAAAIT
jgi:hypothetical protein